MKISNFFHNFKKNLFSTSKQCPNCGTILKFPNNKGNLKVTCPHCSTSFIVQFQRVNPFKYNKNIPWKANLQNIKYQFQNLYKANPWLIWLFILLFSFMLYWIVQGCAGQPQMPPLNQGTGV